MQNFGGTTKRIMVLLKKDYCRVNYHSLPLNKFESTEKETYKLSKLLGRQYKRRKLRKTSVKAELLAQEPF